MGKAKVDKVLYQEVITSEETGEVIKHRAVYKAKDEPDFVKLYIDCVLTLKGLKKGLNPILLAFLRFMNYASINEFEGGQVIFTNKMMKQTIANELGVSIKRIEQAITEFVKSGVFRRVSVGTYQVNPNIIGKGDWKDIKNIRATFDFGNRDVIAAVVEREEADMTENQQRLEDEYQQMSFGGIENGETLAVND